MNRGLPIVIVLVTLVLIVMAWFTSGGVERHELQAATAPDKAVRLMLSQIKSHNFDAAYARLANRSDVDKTSFMHEFNGNYGSLLTYATLESFDVSPLKTSGEDASVRDILIHMIEEYARHCGHADLLRECIDGRTGF